jgi:hypothetical protein
MRWDEVSYERKGVRSAFTKAEMDQWNAIGVTDPHFAKAAIEHFGGVSELLLTFPDRGQLEALQAGKVKVEWFQKSGK